MLMHRDHVKARPYSPYDGLIHRATRGEIKNPIIFDTMIWAQSESERRGHGKNHRIYDV